ncbi:ABC transporter permease [Neobacillus sp.]|uniref:ABC transporter permease n=1 Tax=Neobacillus sp. TaxID=2675273 RepID=UPI00289C9BBB|nr:ABC transporter permease [Neobacillus sp.]
MLKSQLMIELKKSITITNLLIWAIIIILIPAISFFHYKNGYMFSNKIELFQSIVSGFIPLLFPVIVIFIFLQKFTQELKNNYITYVQPRIPKKIYLLSKGITNALLTALVTFMMIFIPFIFAVYIEPKLGIIKYVPSPFLHGSRNVTFSQFLSLGQISYGVIYSLWVTINAVVYSTISFSLLLLIKSRFVALSAPFLFYHIFNFIAGVLGVARFSPVSTVFPFNIQQQPLWTVLIPFLVLILILIILLVSLRRSNEVA